MNLDGSRSRRSFFEWLRHTFRERQIYVRSDGGLRYLIVRPWHLAGAACVCASGLAWVSMASYTFVYNTSQISDARSRTERVQTLYDGRIATMQTAVERLNEKLMLDQGSYVGKVDKLRGDFEKLTDRQRRLEVFFKQGWLPSKVLRNETSDPVPKPRSGNEKVDEPTVQHAAISASPFKTKSEAEQPLKDLRGLFEDFASRQLKLLAHISAHGEQKAARLRDVYARLGLKPDKVAAEMTFPARAIGGPLLEVQQGQQPLDGFDRELIKAQRNFVEADKLLRGITLMPIRLPFADGYRLTSGFGFRRDPFKDVLAMHTGVDLMTAYGAAIAATAAGVVIRAEMSDVYGRVIDIRHDNGITTRYAHMSAMEVKEDERVAAGQLIGRVGTSGRSTGPHLHYETRVNGKPIDPYEFLRVARDVLQEKAK